VDEVGVSGSVDWAVVVGCKRFDEGGGEGCCGPVWHRWVSEHASINVRVRLEKHGAVDSIIASARFSEKATYS